MFIFDGENHDNKKMFSSPNVRYYLVVFGFISFTLIFKFYSVDENCTTCTVLLWATNKKKRGKLNAYGHFRPVTKQKTRNLLNHPNWDAIDNLVYSYTLIRSDLFFFICNQQFTNETKTKPNMKLR